MALCAWHIYRKNTSLRDIGFHGDKMLKYALLGVLLRIPPGIGEYFIITPVATLLVGLLFGYPYHRTGNLTALIIAHGVGNNVILVSVLPYLFT